MNQGIATLVMLALLWAQGLALGHGLGHGVPPSAVAGSASMGDESTARAWGHAAGTAACVLVDHLLVGQAPGFEPTPAQLQALPSQPGPAPKACTAAATVWWPYLARGPPSS